VAADDPRTLGILGGSFNPPHLGHLELARHARAELGTEHVTLMPVAVAPYKPQAEDPGAQHRLAMARLLVAGSSGLSVCDLEVKRGGPSYTVDTLREIHASHPDTELTFIAGADTVMTLAGWREPEALAQLAKLAVAARGSASRERVLEAVSSIRAPADGAGVKLRFLNMAPIEVSSSEVRRRAARGAPLGELVGKAVAEYIAQHGLYGAARSDG
jgi:nicotinate-nucleotide adenylyltransferase